MFMIGSLFIKVECQMKNGTLININSNSFFLRVIFKTITGQLQGDPNKQNTALTLKCNTELEGRESTLKFRGGAHFKYV